MSPVQWLSPRWILKGPVNFLTVGEHSPFLLRLGLHCQAIIGELTKVFLYSWNVLMRISNSMGSLLLTWPRDVTFVFVSWLKKADTSLWQESPQLGVQCDVYQTILYACFHGVVSFGFKLAALGCLRSFLQIGGPLARAGERMCAHTCVCEKSWHNVLCNWLSCGICYFFTSFAKITWRPLLPPPFLVVPSPPGPFSATPLNRTCGLGVLILIPLQHVSVATSP